MSKPAAVTPLDDTKTPAIWRLRLELRHLGVDPAVISDASLADLHEMKIKALRELMAAPHRCR